MPITHVTRENIDQLHHQLQEALEQVAQRLGMKLTISRATYTAASLELSVHLGVVEADGRAVTPEVEEFRHKAHALGLCPQDLGRTFECNGVQYSVEGLVPRARTGQVVLKRLADGVQVRMDAQGVVHFLRHP